MALLMYHWPVTLGLLVGMALATFFNNPFRKSRVRRQHWLVFAPLGVTLLTVAWGGLMWHENSQTASPDWPQHVILGLFFLQLALAVGVVCMLQGYRWFALAAVLFEQWICLACAFVASMAVSGDWI